MFCRCQAIGLALISFGAGVVFGCILPLGLFLVLLSLALIAAGVFVARM